ncbi:MAG: hypothetical protein ACI4FO_02140 [Acutalibacteraceae bacterium]
MKKLNKATVILIASMLVLALTLVATFSWFPRAASYDENTVYYKLNLNQTARIKYNGMSVNTSVADMVDGKLTTTGDKVQTGTNYKVPAHGTLYFRTAISGAKEGTTNVSLTGLTLTGAENLLVCLLSPMKSSSSYADDMVLAEHIAVTQASGCEVEWYLYNSTEKEVTVQFTQLPSISYYD